MISTILGGIGLFLLGMILLTDGLKALAGDSLRNVLARFAGGRLSSVAAGAGVTALVQSSSATTLTTIGFVSAGLLTFEQALGVIFGANLGTTSTSWLVSILGLKFSISKVALPLVGVGALTRLLSRDRLANLGLALAGFGLIFVGIGTLQLGMESLSTRINPGSFPDATLQGRLALVLIGVVMTLVLQSSSAAVATTLLALHAGTIDLTQAAALAVGQNVGTTVTAALGSIGANVAAKRTALGHILFNVLTGVMAFVVLAPAVYHLERLNQSIGITSPAILLAQFHTAFNLLGVVLFVPFTGPFARLVARLVPQRGPHLTRHLGPIVAKGPLAVDAAGLTLREILEEALAALSKLLAGDPNPAPTLERFQAVDAALLETREFLSQVQSKPQGGTQYARHLGLLHVLDHLDRLSDACRENPALGAVRQHPDVKEVLVALERAIDACSRSIDSDAPLDPASLGEESLGIASSRKEGRPRLLLATAAGEVAPGEASKVLETVRWIDRLAFHTWRAAHHLFPSDPSSIPEASLPSDEGESPEMESAEEESAGEAVTPDPHEGEPKDQ
jgi:phosphate:Na+ symporter